MIKSLRSPCRVFLANAPYFLKERYGRLASLGATLPHLGLLLLAAVLRQEGHSVRLVDASAQGLGYEATVEAARQFQPDMIALSAVTPALFKTVHLARMLREACPGVPIILGGAHVTAVPLETLRDYPVFDYGVVGEGEATLVELIQALCHQQDPAVVPGVVCRRQGQVFQAPPRPPIQDLDSLPFPAWDLLEGFPARYHPALFKYQRLPSTHIVSARGCPNTCIFCDTRVFGRRVRFHSAPYVLDMIGHLIQRFGMREVVFEDDQFLIYKDRVAAICEGLLQKGWGISWSCSGRVNSIKDPQLLRLMKRSGCWQINYGIESGNQEILDLAGKGTTLAQIEQAVRLTEQAGIRSKGYFIFGLPLETRKTLEQTIRFAKSIPLSDMSVFTLTPFPGSRMHDLAEQYGTLERDYEKMNLLNVVYVPHGLTKETLQTCQARFMREFYLRPRILADYLLRAVRHPAHLGSMARALAGFVSHSLSPPTTQ